MRPEIKKIRKQCDSPWSEIIKIKAGYKCEYCGKGKPEVVLHSHHIFSRIYNTTRWLIENGVCLCAGHHKYFAHVKTQDFEKWCRTKRDYDMINEIRRLKFKKDYQTMKIYLTQELKKLKQ